MIEEYKAKIKTLQKEVKELNEVIGKQKNKIDKLETELQEYRIELCAMNTMINDLTDSEIIFTEE